jgi:hypothetical protein
VHLSDVKKAARPVVDERAQIVPGIPKKPLAGRVNFRKSAFS